MSHKHEVYALRYATVSNRAPHQNFLFDDHTASGADLDYFVWLIKLDDDGIILVDTGFGEHAAKARGRTLLIHPVKVLEEFGVSAESVRDIIVTHMHYDHAGNLDRFPNARFHIQEREMAFATGRCMCHGGLRQPFSVEDVTLMVRHVYSDRVLFHSGDAILAPGISIHHVGGHSDGLQIVRVETERGPVVLAADALHFYDNLHRRNPFPIVYNVGDVFEGWLTVERLAGHPDRIIPGHDPLVARTYPRASDAVEVFALHRVPMRTFAK